MLIFSDYNFDIGIKQNDFKLRLFSGITDYTAAVHFNYYPVVNHKLIFGTDFTRHIFIPSSVSARSSEEDLEIGSELRQYANDLAVFINDDFDLNDRIRISAGLRFTYFQQVGPFTRYIRDDEGNFSDTITYSRGEQVAAYPNIEPRISMRYSVNNTSSVKASYTQNYQNLHLASVSTIILPTDLWIPSSDRIKPQFGVQYAIGYFINFADNLYESSVEVYYKTMDHLIEYTPGSSPGDDVGDNADNNLISGSGESYGLELFLKKNYGRFNGWIGYTLSKTTRTFPEINKGNTYPAKYDRRHDVSVTGTYEINEHWTASAVFVFATGNTFTPILGRYFMDNGTLVTEYGDYNGYRMKDYHRLDISLNYKLLNNKKFNSSFNFSVYNIYNRHNPYFIYFDSEGEISQGVFKTFAKQVTVFPVMPSISFNFSF
jgi:hypothetical protein